MTSPRAQTKINSACECVSTFFKQVKNKLDACRRASYAQVEDLLPQNEFPNLELDTDTDVELATKSNDSPRIR